MFKKGHKINLRRKVSLLTRKKMSLIHKGKKHTLLTRKKISDALKGKKLSKERRKNISLSLIGRKIPKKVCEKISKALKGKIPYLYGKTVNSKGYVLIYQPNHPFRQKTAPYVLEHRLVMEKHINRYLTPKEVVHHINKNTSDNSIENLMLFKNSGKHSKYHKLERT
jgi:hypothetical protein